MTTVTNMAHEDERLAWLVTIKEFIGLAPLRHLEGASEDLVVRFMKEFF